MENLIVSLRVRKPIKTTDTTRTVAIVLGLEEYVELATPMTKGKFETRAGLAKDMHDSKSAKDTRRPAKLFLNFF